MTPEAAAGLQIAIWEVLSGLGGQNFSVIGNDYGASLLISTITAPGYNGPTANLVGISGAGQDYVIPRPTVPDGGATVTLFSLVLVGLAATGLMKSKPWPFQKESQ
jgi:hypothetical protein